MHGMVAHDVARVKDHCAIYCGALFVFAATMILDESSAGSNEQDYFILGGLALIGVYAFVRGLMRMKA